MASRRKKGTQPTLSAERIRDVALELIEADGLDEFSTRKLGRALGVEAMAIYWYYPSKEALLDAVVENLIGRIDGPLDPVPAPNAAAADKRESDWIAALRRLAHAYRGIALDYPNAFPLLATRRFATEATYGFLENLFTLARAHGLDAHTTARWYRLVSSYCSGVTLNELAGRRAEALAATREPPLDEAAFQAKFPELAAVSGWLSSKHFDDVFEFGLEVLLGALASAYPGKVPGTAAKHAHAK